MYIVDFARRSFVPGAQESEFPLQNLPYGVFSTATDPQPRIGVAIGDQVLDLAAVARAGCLHSVPVGVLASAALNPLAALGRTVWTALRKEIAALLEAGSDFESHVLRESALIPQRDVRMHLPFDVTEFTDFYASKHHAFNCGVMFRGPDNALPQNWMHMPIAYNGRSSSIVASGTPIRRPNGQLPPHAGGLPSWGPTQALDFELEVGLFIGGDTALGTPVAIDEAHHLMFGVVLLNDWSARDIQRWEYVPLGPFQGKAFGTSISPWVVTMDALEPFATPAPTQDPAVLPYLQEARPRTYDVTLTVELRPEGAQPTALSVSNIQHLYWSFAQQIAHHTGGGCNLRIGDLLGSGTISGPTRDALGCLLEMTRNGTEPVPLTGGGERRFVQDGDTVTFRGMAQKNGVKVGFGALFNTISPAS